MGSKRFIVACMPGAMAACATPGFAAPINNIVLVHGAFADGSGWKGVADILVAAGFKVSVVQHPDSSLAGDVAATRRILDRQDGPAVLVGHSYGGTVITDAGNHPKVKALVYVAAHAPESGEDPKALRALRPAPTSNIVQLGDGFIIRNPPNATYTSFNAGKVTSAGITADLRIGRFTPKAMYTQIKLAAPGGSATMRNPELGTRYALARANTLGASMTSSRLQGLRWHQLNLVDMLALSPRTVVYAAAAFQRASGDGAHAVIQGAAPASGRSQRVLRVGIDHSF